MRIGLNAHLLSGRAGYRSAGIHGYIDGLLRHLPAELPDDWQLTAMVGAANSVQYDGIAMRRSRIDTESPPKRIVWEQVAQPLQLGAFDLYHALAFVAPLWLRTPMVVTIYDLSFVHYPQRLPLTRRLYLRWLTALTCHRARRVIAISESTAQDLTATFNIPAEKIDVAAPGYDASVFKPLPADTIAVFRQQHDLPECFWLFLGTLEPRKNLPTLLEAYAQLPQSQRLPLVLAGGKGWQYDAIFAAVERHRLSDEIVLPGYIPAGDLPLWYNSAEVFIYPSVFEGFGLPVLEAMACGTPVIVADTSSLPEVVGEAGMRVPPHDVAAWHGALARAMTDATWRQQASEDGISRAARYNWQTTAQQTVKSYSLAMDWDV